MVTAGDERVPYEGGGSGKKFQINEEPQDVSQEAGKYNPSGASEPSTHKGGDVASIGVSELEQILILKTLSRSEIERLMVMLHSKISPSDIIIDERDGAKRPPPPNSSPSSDTRLEAVTTIGSLKKHKKHGGERDSFHPSAAFSSRVVEEQIASPSQYLELLNNSASGLPKTLKASPQHPATIENLLEELLSNIFTRLLAKQLAQMRSVNKSWNALLSRSSFIKSHLHRSIHNCDHLLAFYYEELSENHPEPFAEPFTVHSSRRYSHHKLTNSIKVPVNTQPRSKNDIKIIGSVNGLICSSYDDIFDNDSVIHIWNPSLSAVLTLPPYSTPSQCFESIQVSFRFGFDPKTDDYKVVKLTGLIRKPAFGQPAYSVKWWLQIEIYSMRKGTWEFITARFPSHITSISDSDDVCADGHDGHIHWLCRIGHSQTIVAFDLGSETFREIPLPYSIVDHRTFSERPLRYPVVDHGIVLGVLAGKLCVMSCKSDKTFEVWVMAEYGVAESWVKRHVLPQISAYPRIFGFTSHNELLVVDSSYIFLYDPIAKKERAVLENFHYYRRPAPCKIIEYVDSLVWVAPDKYQMVDGA